MFSSSSRAGCFRNFVFDGDSHVYGDTNPAAAFPVFLHDYANLQPCPFYNVAHNGWKWENVAANFDADTRAYWPTTTGIKANFWLHVGSNNIGAGDSGASIYTGVAAILASAAAAGFYVGATIPWNSPTWVGTAKETELLTYRASMMTDPSITNGLLLDGMTMFPDPDTLPYFNGIDNHLSPTGQAYYAQQLHALLLSTGNHL